LWQHIAAVREGGKISLYLNGKKAGESTAGSGVIGNNAAEVTLGLNAIKTWKFIGTMDEIKIFTYALSEEEIIETFTVLNGQAVKMSGMSVITENVTTARGGVKKMSGSVYTGGKWEVRRAINAKVSKDLIEGGMIPAWDAKIEDEENEISIEGDTTGKYMGIMLVGKRIPVPKFYCFLYHAICSLFIFV